MTKEEFIYLCQEPLIYYTYEQAESFANNIISEGIDLSDAYVCLSKGYSSMRKGKTVAELRDEFIAAYDCL